MLNKIEVKAVLADWKASGKTINGYLEGLRRCNVSEKRIAELREVLYREGCMRSE